MEKDKQINFRLETSLHDRLKSEAQQRGLNIAQLVRIFVHEGLAARCPDFHSLDDVRISCASGGVLGKGGEKREKILFKAAVEAVLLGRSLLTRSGGEELVKESKRQANTIVEKHYPDFTKMEEE